MTHLQLTGTVTAKHYLRRVFHPTEFGRAHLFALELMQQKLEQEPNLACVIEFESEHEVHGLQNYLQTYNPNMEVMLSEEQTHVLITLKN